MEPLSTATRGQGLRRTKTPQSDENASSDEDEGPYAELELMLKQAQRTVGKTSAQMQKTEVGELNVCVVAIATKNGGDPDEY